MLSSQAFNYKEIYGVLSTQKILYHICLLFLRVMFTQHKSTTMLRTEVLEDALHRIVKIQTALINLRILNGLLFSTGVTTTCRTSLFSQKKQKKDGYVPLQTLQTPFQYLQLCSKPHQMNLNLF